MFFSLYARNHFCRRKILFNKPKPDNHTYGNNQIQEREIGFRLSQISSITHRISPVSHATPENRHVCSFGTSKQSRKLVVLFGEGGRPTQLAFDRCLVRTSRSSPEHEKSMDATFGRAKYCRDGSLKVSWRLLFIYKRDFAGCIFY